ncbi:MAG: hypothetical protein RMI91_04665 [Gemmatales bacterium]|nr:hypothetical protein [Gemmatales bacterium]MDW7993928.1 hypothetical protein [Gemmatales bacterium]
MTAGSVPPQDNTSASQATSAPSLAASDGQLPTQGASQPTSSREPSNPFYVMLLLFSVAFVLTGLVLSLVPWPELPLWLRRHGWKILLVEMALVIITGLASMALDRWRSVRPGRPEG